MNLSPQQRARLDPNPRTRAISANLPHSHRPETLAVPGVNYIGGRAYLIVAGHSLNGTGRLTTMSPVEPGILYANQIEAVTNLDHSLKRNRPRALIQLASGSGNTIAAIAAI
jgi:type I restriction enzyme R subunit